MLRFGLPIALQNLLATTMSMVDTVMIGTQGELSVAAVGLCAQFGSLLFSCYYGFIGGGVLFFSQYWGEKNEKGVCRSFGIMTVFLLAVGLIFGGLGVFAPELVMSVYTDKANIQAIGVSYLRVTALSYPFQVLAMGISSLLRSTERVRIPLAASFASLLTNLVVNWLLIFGNFGLPKLGVVGAGVGTVCAGAVYVLMLLVLARKAKHPFLFRLRDHFAWGKGSIKLFFSKCIPIICNELFIGVGNMGINIVMGRQSESAIAAMAVFRVLEGFVYALFGGFSNSGAIIVGKAIGAGEHLDAYNKAKKLRILCPLFTLSICALMFAFNKPIFDLTGLEAEAQSYGRVMLMVYMLAATIRTCNYIQNDTYRVGGDPIYGTVLEITCMYLLVLPCVCLSGLVLKLPFLAVFCLMYVDEPFRLFMEIRHTNSGRWIRPVTAKGQATINEFRSMIEQQRKEKKLLKKAG